MKKLRAYDEGLLLNRFIHFEVASVLNRLYINLSVLSYSGSQVMQQANALVEPTRAMYRNDAGL